MKTPKRHFRIDDVLWTRFKVKALDRGITASNLLRELITNCVEENNVDTFLPTTPDLDLGPDLSPDIEVLKKLSKEFLGALGINNSRRTTKEIIDELFKDYPPEYLECALNKEFIHRSFYK